MKLAIAQINTKIGDFEYNIQKASDYIKQAKSKHIDIIVFPELTTTGYPPRDLLLAESFIKQSIRAVKLLAKECIGITAIIGTPIKSGKKLFNGAAVIENGKVIAKVKKKHLPNYKVFDEKRYFHSNKTANPVTINGKKIGVLICEDLWFHDVAGKLKAKGAELLISLNSSPFDLTKQARREKACMARIDEFGLPVIFANQIGAQDEMVYDGGSFAIDKNKQYIVPPKYWDEELIIVEPQKSKSFSEQEHVYQALMLGLKDYVTKSGFSKVLLGISGGVDSAFVATLAVDTLGAKNVLGVRLPSKFSSKHSLNDAEELAENLGISIVTHSIEQAHQLLQSTLLTDALADENLQARLRGIYLMALSNQSGAMLLGTGNKSEYATGYSTLYGDMCGGFAPIKDIYKTQVYELSNWRNHNIPYHSQLQKNNVIPKNSILKAPSAELKENQTDQDSLPDYDLLDKILFQLIEEQKSPKEILKLGFKRATVNKVAKLLKNTEYKRYQAAIGSKISTNSFDRERRFPITY